MDINKRSRLFALLLYEEDESHKKAIQYIKNNYDYAMILHNQDCTEDGEIKKEHYHVVIRFRNARTIRCVFMELGIEPNYIQVCRSFDGAVRYLIHKDDVDKFQYSATEIQTNIIQSVNKALCDKAEEDDIVPLILAFIESSGKLSVTELCTYCVNNGFWSAYRRGASVFHLVLQEHNKSLGEKLFREKQQEIYRQMVQDKRKNEFKQISIDWNDI